MPQQQGPQINLQVNVNAKVGLTFAAALRAFLRQDPDIIMVGEIRDRETADTAVQAALTGHLVLSTLHTIDAAETVGRMIEFFPPEKQEVIRAIMAGVLRTIRKTDLMEPFPRLKAFYERCCARPAWQRTLSLCAERLGMNVEDIR